jgi:hypothetical protein
MVFCGFAARCAESLWLSVSSLKSRRGNRLKRFPSDTAPDHRAEAPVLMKKVSPSERQSPSAHQAAVHGEFEVELNVLEAGYCPPGI